MATLAEEPIPCLRQENPSQMNQSLQLSEASEPITHRRQSDIPLLAADATTSPVSYSPALSSPVIQKRITNNGDTLDFDQILNKRKEPDDEAVTTSPPRETPPPSKRAKYIFKRCFDATFNPANIPGTSKILAPDSDEEDERQEITFRRKANQR